MAVGRLNEAGRLWEEVLSSSPNHSQALFHLGQHALYSKQPARARMLLERAAALSPNDAAIELNLSFVFRAMGDNSGEMGALTRALTIDPYCYPALLARAMLLERTGLTKAAARTYKNVIDIAPPADQLAPGLRQSLDHGREVVKQNAVALEAYIEERLRPARLKHAGEALERFEECKAIAVGAKKAYAQQPDMLLFPRLPAIQFYDNANFPWISQLEAATDAMRGELLKVLKEDHEKFAPYVNHPPGSPLNQWAELNRSARWSVFYLWKDGERLDENCARCPQTRSVCDAIPMLEVPGYGPTVLFSLLSPHTRIPPHSGSTNARLIVHLPLIVPQGCGFRVGNETREWQVGKAWVFDDTIEHEAWNDSDELRAIVMIDIWNPYLTIPERDLVSDLLVSLSDYYKS